MKRILVLLAVVLAIPAVVAADAIRLRNGRTIEIEGWRDAGDAIEFASGGGIVRISKREVERIDGRATRGDLRMYSSGVSGGGGTATAALGPGGVVSQMKDLLGQGDGLFGQTALSAAEKAGAFRRLTEKWREFEVPDALRATHDKGRAALQSATDAFGADAAEPDTRERIEKARKEVQAILEEVKQLAPAS